MGAFQCQYKLVAVEKELCLYYTVDDHKFENQNFEILFIINLQVSLLSPDLW